MGGTMVDGTAGRWRVAMAGWLWLLSGCPGDAVPGVPTPGDGSTTSDMPGITTFGGTVDPTLPGDGTLGGDGTTTSGTADGTTTSGASTSTSTGGDESTSTGGGGSTSTGGGGSTSTGGGESTSTGGGSSTDGGSTSTGGGSTSTGGGSTSTGGGSSSTGPACHDVGGNYDDCVDMAGAIDTVPCNAPGASTCLTTSDGMGGPLTGGVCSVDSCLDECDCPAAPPTGNAVVACADVTGDPTQLFCHLDCSMGETCPTGMLCFAGFVCIWPTDAGLGEPYGDCFNNPTSICGFDGTCLNDDVMMPTIGVCSTECPGGVGDCPAAPPGGTATVDCQDLTGDLVDECFLNCAGGAACPPGMSCFANICVWS